ncbi:MAG: rod shape-determining protein MreC [Rhodospirillales bacterium]|nr:rod shape-determining protein MreC [Rhodospirillales bacterium]MCB9996646.1 rod shape-determining protein MreC [Rhodospirillales bacterium]
MKLSSRSKSKARIISLQWWGARAAPFIFVLLAVLIFMFSAAAPTTLEGVRMRTTDMFSPVLAAVNKPFYQASEYVRAVSGIAELQAENIRLKQENTRLREWHQTALTLQAENENLQKLLNIKLPPQHSYITARVVADSGNAFAKSLLVTAGSDDGIEAGQAVLAGDGLVGRVIESGHRTARVLLLYDINSRIPVLIQGTNQRAIMAGNNDSLPTLLHLPPEIEIKPGTRVITSGHGGLYPYGLPVGEIARDDHGALVVKPFAMTDRVQMVRVIKTADDVNLRHKTQ